jgi:hypothetical protein
MLDNILSIGIKIKYKTHFHYDFVIIASAHGNQFVAFSRSNKSNKNQLLYHRQNHLKRVNPQPFWGITCTAPRISHLLTMHAREKKTPSTIWCSIDQRVTYLMHTKSGAMKCICKK